MAEASTQSLAAFAAVFNPIDAAEEEILVFHSDQEKSFGLMLENAANRKNGPGNGDDLGGKPRTPHIRPIIGGDTDSTGTGVGGLRPGSALTTILWKNLIRVYAIIDKDSTVRQISPAMQKLTVGSKTAVTTLKGITALASTRNENGDEAWLYYLKEDPKQIVEYSLRSKTETTLNSYPVHNKSSLAAYYDGKQRYVVYQRAGRNEIVTHSCGGDEQDYALPSTTNARQGTPITASFSNGQVRIYYTMTTSVSNDDYVHRSTHDGQKWSDPTKLRQSDQIDQTSLLTSSVGPDSVHVFYAMKDTAPAELSHFKDPLN